MLFDLVLAAIAILPLAAMSVCGSSSDDFRNHPRR